MNTDYNAMNCDELNEELAKLKKHEMEHHHAIDQIERQLQAARSLLQSNLTKQGTIQKLLKEKNCP